MCEFGNTVHLELAGSRKPIDSCIHRIVLALNDAGVTTVSSCCGHGHQPGQIVLDDGRTLLVVVDGRHEPDLSALMAGVNEMVWEG